MQARTNVDIRAIEQVIEVEGVKIGLCHGHCVVPAGDEAALLALQRKLGVDVLVTGGSHQVKVTKRNGALLLDPGSVTGADKGFQSGFNPSYVVMDVHAGKVGTSSSTLFVPLVCTFESFKSTSLVPGLPSAVGPSAVGYTGVGSSAAEVLHVRPGGRRQVDCVCMQRHAKACQGSCVRLAGTLQTDVKRILHTAMQLTTRVEK